MKQLLLFALLVAFTQCIHAQSVAINAHDTVAHPSAGLDVNFANKGLLIPRASLVSTTDTVTIPSPANSLMVYNTNPTMTNGNGVGFYFYCDTGCTGKGWKFVNYSNNQVSTSGEWAFHSKRTFDNSSADISFTGLLTHDKWKLVIDIQNMQIGAPITVTMQVNSTVTNYGVQFVHTNYANSYNPFYGPHWVIYSEGGSVIANSMVAGEVIVTGKYTPNQAQSKILTASLSANTLVAPQIALAGYVNYDPTDVHLITIKTSSPITGRVELWYRDYK